MANDILFRCWDYELKKMFYQHDENYLQLYTENKFSLFNEDDNLIVSNIVNDNNIFMQYIGWDDKNGKKIYYGDIVKYKAMWNKTDNERGTAIIHRFLNNGAGIMRTIADVEEIMIEGKKFKITYSSWNGELVNIWFDEKTFDLDVVGNIFETPYLINH